MTEFEKLREAARLLHDCCAICEDCKGCAFLTSDDTCLLCELPRKWFMYKISKNMENIELGKWDSERELKEGEA